MNELDKINNENMQIAENIKTLELEDLNADLREENEDVMENESVLSAWVGDYYMELQRLAEHNDLMTKRMYTQTVRMLVKGLQKQYAYNYSIYKEHASHHTFEKFCSFMGKFFAWTVFLPITLVRVLVKFFVQKQKQKKLEREEKQMAHE